MNTLSKNMIRIWITLASLFAFSIGWVALGHSEKPVPLTQFPESSTFNTIELAPVPSLEALTKTNQPAAASPSFAVRSIPRLRTRGS